MQGKGVPFGFVEAWICGWLRGLYVGGFYRIDVGDKRFPFIW